MVRSVRALTGGLLVALLAVTGCGASEFHYVTNSDDQLYFKVPSSWNEVDSEELRAAETSGVDPDSRTARVLDELTWSVAYDGAAPPTSAHVFGGSINEPVVYAKVQRLLQSQQGAISLDALRNLLLPVTDNARNQAEEAGQLLPGFELLSDEVLTPGEGVRGVHEIFSYRISGQLQTFDQTAFINDDASKVYLLLVRCTANCYIDRQDELKNIVRSFTVKDSS